MKKFRFSLEKLLKIRDQRVKGLKGELFQEQKEWELLKQNESTLLCELHTQQEAMLKERHQGNFQKQKAFENYLRILQENLAAIQEPLEEKKQRVHLKKQIVTQAIQGRKIIEKLREKQYSQWQTKSNKEESAALDEITTQNITSH